MRNKAGNVILWRNLVWHGYEACRVFSRGALWYLEGTAVFSYESKPCHLRYRITCNAAWRTRSAKVVGWVGDEIVSLQIEADDRHHWWRNKVEAPGVSSCIDLDLNFSPSTNMIAIRRLQLTVGEKKEITAAWLKFPSFTLEPLPQSYLRLEENLYRYESNGGQFKADLVVNSDGFVTDYPGIWKAEAVSGE